MAFNSTPAPDQLEIGNADLNFLTTGHGIIHFDSVAAGKVFLANGTRYVPGDVTTSVITDLAYAVPALTLGVANAAGAADTVIRSDATILVFDAVDPVTLIPDAAAVVGVATVTARRDHGHAIACAAPAVNLSVSSTNAEGDGNNFARSTHSHAITSNSIPDATAAILATTAAGLLTLKNVVINQSAAAGDACVGMRQVDVDKEFQRYQGTAAAADLTRNIVDEGDQASETRIGWLKIYVIDDGAQVGTGSYFVPFYTLSA